MARRSVSVAVGAVLVCSAAASDQQYGAPPLYRGRTSYSAPATTQPSRVVYHSYSQPPVMHHYISYTKPTTYHYTPTCGPGTKYPCPVHCKYSWGHWSECTVTCGSGSRSRDPHIMIKAAYGGLKCPPTQVGKCATKACPSDCQYSDWSQWGDCDKECGHGVQYRERSIYSNAGYGGKKCPATEDKKPCMNKYCLTDCKYTWGEWSECSVSCGGGSTEREAVVTYKPTHGGQACPPSQHATCNTDYCPVDCYVQDFGDWGDCSVTCGPGTQYRAREVATKPMYGGKKCPYTSEKRGCQAAYCPIDCAYDWGGWSECSQECGGGTQYRAPNVTYAPAHGGKECPPQESRTCNTDYCPVDCQVHPWHSWTACDKKCGMGISSRERTVKYAAAYGGKACPYLYEEHDCNLGYCAQDCVYGWGDWGSCDKSCGGGHQYRKANVTTYPHNGPDGTGKTCPPDESKYCNTDYCAVDCEMSEWGDWTACDKTCGDGYQSRERSIKYQPKYGGQKCGSTHQKKQCFVYYCPIACDYEWSDWSTCTYSCDGGLSKRSPAVKTHGRYGGAKCPQDETKLCGTDPCPQPYAKEVLTYAKFPDASAATRKAPVAQYAGRSVSKAAGVGYGDYTGTEFIRPYVAATPQHHEATYAPTPMPIYESICLNDCVSARDGECDDGGKNAFYKHCQVGHDCADCGAREVPLDLKAQDALRTQLPPTAFKREKHSDTNGGSDYLLAPRMYSVTDHEKDLYGFSRHGGAIDTNTVDDDHYTPSTTTYRPTYAPTYKATAYKAPAPAPKIYDKVSKSYEEAKAEEPAYGGHGDGGAKDVIGADDDEGYEQEPPATGGESDGYGEANGWSTTRPKGQGLIYDAGEHMSDPGAGEEGEGGDEYEHGGEQGGQGDFQEGEQEGEQGGEQGGQGDFQGDEQGGEQGGGQGGQGDFQGGQGQGAEEEEEPMPHQHHHNHKPTTSTFQADGSLSLKLKSAHASASASASSAIASSAHAQLRAQQPAPAAHVSAAAAVAGTIAGIVAVLALVAIVTVYGRVKERIRLSGSVARGILDANSVLEPSPMVPGLENL